MTVQKAPQDCNSMTELRREIDVIDAQLIDILVTRSHYIDRAVELKRAVGLPARLQDRVDEVLSNVRAKASEGGLDDQLAHRLWSELIEWSIQREIKELGS